MKPHRPFLLGVVFIVFILSALIHAKDLKGNIQIGILQWAESPAAYTWTCEGFIEGMKASGYEEGKNVHFDIKIAEGDREKARTMAKAFVKRKVDLICALGTIPSLVALEATKEIPIVYSIVGKPKPPELLILGIFGEKYYGSFNEDPDRETTRNDSRGDTKGQTIGNTLLCLDTSGDCDR